MSWDWSDGDYDFGSEWLEEVGLTAALAAGGSRPPYFTILTFALILTFLVWRCSL